MSNHPDQAGPVLHLTPARIPWDGLWPQPDPADGDGSQHAESAANDGTPGAVPTEEDPHGR